MCKEAILKESYIKLRQSAVEALMSLTQVHDKSDFSDVVLREQISKLIFIVLPQIATVLIKVCQEDTLRGPYLIKLSLKTLGRFLCLILEDYEKKLIYGNVSNEDFKNLLKGSDANISTPSKGPKIDVTKVEKSSEWLATTAQNLSKLITNLKSLRASQYKEIRYEIAVFSFNLLNKCFPNVQIYSRFLIENLISCCDDDDEIVKNYSKKCIKDLRQNIPNLNQEISELFTAHLIMMPRIILTGMETEQIAGFILLNNFILTDNSLLENQPILEKFINILLSCCEMEISNELVLFESPTINNKLNDDFYQMQMPWKKFKNFKSETAQNKFHEICKNIGASSVAHIFVNHLLDNINSLEHLILLIEFLSCENSSLESSQIENVIEEFLNENYWTMEVDMPKEIVRKSANEEWYQDSTPGLYESAVEVKLRDVRLEDEDEEIKAKLNLKMIRYNILCTCFVVELIGCAAIKLGKKFQRFILRSMHKILEKAGSSKFLIKSSGLYSINCITRAMGFNDVYELIDEHSDFILFNIQNQLKRNYDDESILDMLSVVFKFSKTSIAPYVEDIIETAANRLTNSKFGINFCAYLKLFNLYACSIKIEEEHSENIEENVKRFNGWNDFVDQCLYELKKIDIEDESNLKWDENCSEENCDENEESPQEVPSEPKKSPLPLHVQLILKILNSSIPFFASSNPTEVILVHEIFENALPTLHKCDDTNFLPTIHQMWYPFTKQFQGNNFVILQHSFRLLKLVTSLAKDFVYRNTTDKAIPIINKFLSTSFSHKNVSYTQEFKLQREILSGYGQLIIDLGIEDKMLDEIVNLILKFKNHQNDQIVKAVQSSIDVLIKYDPILMNFKLQNL